MASADDIKRIYELHSKYCWRNHRMKPQGFARCAFPWFDLLDGSEELGHFALFAQPHHMRLYRDRLTAEEDRRGHDHVLLNLDTGQILDTPPEQA